MNDRKSLYDEWNGYRATLSQIETARKMGIEFPIVEELEKVWQWPESKRNQWFRESGMTHEEKLVSRLLPLWPKIFLAIVVIEVIRWVCY